MGRKPHEYTVVFLNSGAIDHETFTDEDKLRASLAKLDGKNACALFAGRPVEFQVSREPTVRIGKKKERAPRKPRGERKPKSEKAGTTVGADFFHKDNGSAQSPAKE